MLTGLALFWTHAEKIELTLGDVARLLCENTAALCSMGHRKGAIKVGYDADFVIWDPNSSFKVGNNGRRFVRGVLATHGS